MNKLTHITQLVKNLGTTLKKTEFFVFLAFLPTLARFAPRWPDFWNERSRGLGMTPLYCFAHIMNKLTHYTLLVKLLGTTLKKKLILSVFSFSASACHRLHPDALTIEINGHADSVWHRYIAMHILWTNWHLLPNWSSICTEEKSEFGVFWLLK